STGVAAETLRRELEQCGYEIVCELGKDADFDELPKQHADFVVVGGGDGTVSSVARAMAGAATPIAVLPLGTANNIAKCLGVHCSWRHAIANWRFDSRRDFEFG